MTQWFRACAGDSVPRQGARFFSHSGISIAVFRTASDGFFALENRCPHRGGPLGEGLVHGCRVTCPLHQRHLDLRSGEAVWPDRGAVQTFPVRLRDGAVFVALSDPVQSGSGKEAVAP